MKRRDFIKSTATLAAIGAITATVRAEDEAKTPTREFYELRQYHFRMGPHQRIFDEYFKNAALPALNRAGISPVGVFNVAFGTDTPTAYVLIPCASFEALLAAKEKVLADQDYLKAGAEYIDAKASDPTFVRIESSFLQAFASMPKLEVPAARTRIFELRQYESATEKAGRKKVEMFNSGEVPIFRKAGLTPVFFGETLIGSKLPNLTYMITFADIADRAKYWAAFGSDPDWKHLSGLPEYADTVSNITDLILQPTGYSQI